MPRKPMRNIASVFSNTGINSPPKKSNKRNTIDIKNEINRIAKKKIRE
jgi:hypothetical protein